MKVWITSHREHGKQTDHLVITVFKNYEGEDDIPCGPHGGTPFFGGPNGMPPWKSWLSHGGCIERWDVETFVEMFGRELPERLQEGGANSCISAEWVFNNVDESAELPTEYTEKGQAKLL